MPGLPELFRDCDLSARGKGECKAAAGRRGSPAVDSSLESQEFCRALQGAIDQVTKRFADAQSEYQLVTANSRVWHKWKGEMIAYANVVALLEDMKSRSSSQGEAA